AAPTEIARRLHLGTIQGEDAELHLTEELLKTHLAIFGGTRFGKSKLFELICRELIALGRGFAFIDPHSDTADDLLAYLAARYGELGFLRKNIHYLNPNERLFSFDPFRYHPDPDDPRQLRFPLPLLAAHQDQGHGEHHRAPAGRDRGR